MRPGTVYVAGNSTSGSGFELGRFANQSYELCNDTTNGTIVNGLAVLTSGGLRGEAFECVDQRGDRRGDCECGNVGSGDAGADGVGLLQLRWDRDCGWGLCRAIEHGEQRILSFVPRRGATQPTGMQVLGRVLQASSGSTTVQMFLGHAGIEREHAARRIRFRGLRRTRRGRRSVFRARRIRRSCGAWC